MSEPRLKYGQLAPEGLAKMTALEHHLNTGTGMAISLGKYPGHGSSEYDDSVQAVADASGVVS